MSRLTHAFTAKSDFTTLVTSHEQNFQSFQGYGSTLIKKMGYSPDAYAQMAIQLAVYRLHGKQVGTYEATQMRPFLHGRTETTRTVSKESADFVKSMGMMANINDNSSSLEAKRSLLQKAVKSQMLQRERNLIDTCLGSLCWLMRKIQCLPYMQILYSSDLRDGE